MYSIEWKNKALRQLKRIDKDDQKSVVLAVGELRKWPDCRNVRTLSNRPGYRLRWGKYRIIFLIEKTVKIIFIEEVKKRDEQTY
jgi:mRNA-degrading endonuclease RelE of RelBE toxin-antitoxin system